jgi:hypothetical protein
MGFYGSNVKGLPVVKEIKTKYLVQLKYVTNIKTN